MPHPLKIRVLGGPILSSQRVKIDIGGDMTFGDLYYHIRRQVPKVFTEEQAMSNLAITPENYDLVFVDVEQGRARTMETCDLAMKVKDANWICPALMLRVKDTAVRTVIRAQSERFMRAEANLNDSSGSYTAGVTPKGRQNVSFAQQHTSSGESSREGSARGLQRNQSTYQWSDNTTRTTGGVQLPSNEGMSSSPLQQKGALALSNSDDMFVPGGSVRENSPPGETDPTQLLAELRRKRSTADSRDGDTAAFAATSSPTSILSPDRQRSDSTDGKIEGKSPMRSAWRKVANAVSASSPVSMKEFGMKLPSEGSDSFGGSSPLLRKSSSLTANLRDLQASPIVGSQRIQATPTYANEQSVNSYRERLMALLALYDPKALRKIDRILAKSQGKEEQLLSLAILKYGPEPKYSNVARDGTFVDMAAVGEGMGSTVKKLHSIGEETLRRASSAHTNSVIQIDDDGHVTYKSHFRDLVEFLFEEYDYLTPTAVSLFLQRVQTAPKALAANLALHMQLYKKLRLNIEREDQLSRRILEQQLFAAHHQSHHMVCLAMWYDRFASIERRRFEGMHLILRSKIPPQYFLEWLYLQRQEWFAWEKVVREHEATRQLVWFHAFQRLFHNDLETVHRRAMLVAHRVESHQIQRFCYADRERVRRNHRLVEEQRSRHVLEQWKVIERERLARIVHSMEILEALDRRCDEFAHSSTAFDVPIRSKRFFEARDREAIQLFEVEARMRVVHLIMHRRAWILMEQKFLLSTEVERRLEIERARLDFMAKRRQQFEIGLAEADKRNLNMHFEMGCRWRIIQRRWMNREQVVRNEAMRVWWKEREAIQSMALKSEEDAAFRTLRRLEKTAQTGVEMNHLSNEAEPEGRWFLFFGESATFRHFQRQYLFWQESMARREFQLYAMCRLFWMLESKRRGDIEIREDEEVLFLSSGGRGSQEAVARQHILNYARKGLFDLFEREVTTREELLRGRIIPMENEARLRLFRRGIYEDEDRRRRVLVRGVECVERETLTRWHYYQQEYMRRTLVLYKESLTDSHFLTAKAFVRYREVRDRYTTVKEPFERGFIKMDEIREWNALMIWEMNSLEDAERRELIRIEKHAMRLPLYRREKEAHDEVERDELIEEERDRRIYWKMFQLFQFERIPRLNIQYGVERRYRSMLERSELFQIEAIRREQLAKKDQVRLFNIIEQRRVMDLERIRRKFVIEPQIQRTFDRLEQQNLSSFEQMSRMFIDAKWYSSIGIFEQRGLILFNMVVRSHVRQDEFIARKYVERERLVDEEESARKKFKNMALASLQKWWQKTNLQARQDVIAYANRLQREEDNKVAREGAQKRIEERLAARVAEKLRATVEAKKNQLLSIITGDEGHQRSDIWEAERTGRSDLLAKLLSDCQDVGEMLPHLIKGKQKLVKLIQGSIKIVKTAPSSEQFISLLPPLPRSQRSASTTSPTSKGATKTIPAEEPIDEDGVGPLDMDESTFDMDDDMFARSGTRSQSSSLLPPLRNNNSNSDGPIVGSQSPIAVKKKSSLVSLKGSTDTVPSELYEQSPLKRPNVSDLRSSSGGRNGGGASPAVSLSQVRVSGGALGRSGSMRMSDDALALPPI